MNSYKITKYTLKLRNTSDPKKRRLYQQKLFKYGSNPDDDDDDDVTDDDDDLPEYIPALVSFTYEGRSPKSVVSYKKYPKDSKQTFKSIYESIKESVSYINHIDIEYNNKLINYKVVNDFTIKTTLNVYFSTSETKTERLYNDTI